MAQKDDSLDHSLIASEGSKLTANDAPTYMRAIVLACICSLTLGSYWVFDTPGAIATQLEEWFPNYSDKDNALLYSIYSWPNTVLALFGGFIVDRVTGVRVGALIFCSLIWAGQFIFALGIQSTNYPLCVAGRFIFGLGGESLTVVQNTFVIRWFTGKHLALVFGLVLAFARVGSSINFAVTPTLTNYGVPFSVWFGCGVCTFSLVMCSILVFMDKKGAKYVEADTEAAPAIDEESVNSVSNVEEEEKVDDAPKLQHILSFPLMAWILFLICMFFYQGVLTFYQVASKIMQETGKRFSPATASFFLAIPSFVSIGASPTFGRVVDKYGRAVTLMILASWGMVCCHLVFLGNAYDLFFIHPVAIMLCIGIFYAIGAATMWPLLAHMVPKNMVSTGYGTMTAVQNLGLAVFPLLISNIQETPSIKSSPHRYGIPIIIFVVCVMLASIMAIFLRVIDVSKLNGILNASSSERQEILREQEQQEQMANSSSSEVHYLDE